MEIKTTERTAFVEIKSFAISSNLHQLLLNTQHAIAIKKSREVDFPL